ncbi:MAG: alpha/beta hydrolase, partial [Bacteroidetes bacterium]|nr:alpha/beta hydrolase [Bacteroidota bacterium]
DAYGTGKLKVLKKYHGDKSDDTFQAWADIWLSDGFQYWNLEYLLPSIPCPVLAIQGVEDQYGIESQIDKMVSLVNGRCEKALISDCGHAPHNEQRAFVLDRMATFIGTLMQERQHS